LKVATIFLKYDYGIKERGEGLEKKYFLPAIIKNSDQVVSFWLEENGYPNNIDLLQQNIITFCELNKPDVVFFILMRDEVRIETIKYLSERFITINWFADDQWRFDYFTKYVAPCLTFSITVDKFSIQKYNQIGCKAILSQWAAMDYLPNLNFENIEYKYDISFVGGKNITREWFIYELSKSGCHVECFGSGWNNGRVTDDEIKQIFYNSKINLNLSNSVPNDIRFYKYLLKRIFILNKNDNVISFLKRIKHSIALILGNKDKNVEQIKARNFEIPGFGGFQLSQYALEIEDYYEIGKEIAIFSNIDELKRSVSYYLNNDIERINISKNGYLKTQGNTYDKRINKILNEVKNAKSMFSC